MDILTRLHEQQPYWSKRYAEYFGGLKVAILDIETTGLYAQSAMMILGGMVIPGESNLEVSQYFAENKSQEEELLYAYCHSLSEADVLISYNGSGFDLPFLKQRLHHYALNADLDGCQSFDLYRALHFHSQFREILPNLKQKTVEAFFGYSANRVDEITGLESINLYEEYCRNGSPSAKEKILLHNHDDLIQLAALLQVLDKLDLHKILYYEGFTVAHEEKRIYVRNLSLSRRSLKITAITCGIPIDYYSFEVGYQAVHLAASRTLTLEIPFESQHGVAFVDLETIPMDFSALIKYPYYQNGYLILRDRGQLHFAEINNAVKIILKEILKFF